MNVRPAVALLACMWRDERNALRWVRNGSPQDPEEHEAEDVLLRAEREDTSGTPSRAACRLPRRRWGADNGISFGTSTPRETAGASRKFPRPCREDPSGGRQRGSSDTAGRGLGLDQ